MKNPLFIAALTGLLFVSSPAWASRPIKISTAPAAVSFGGVRNGTLSEAKIVTVKNTGTSNLAISSVVLSGRNSGEFSQVSDCSIIAPNASCSISIRITPASAGTKSAILNIAGVGSAKPVSIKMSATALSPKITATASSLSFGKVTQGMTSAAKTVTIKNTGKSDLSISAVQMIGTNPDDFVQTGNCDSATIPAGGSCTASVTFTPYDTGSRSAILSISSNDQKRPTLNIGLSGQGSVVGNSGMPHFHDIVSAFPKIRTAAKAVVRIHTAGQSGTGFFTSSTGRLMTNNHVLGNTVCPIEGCYVQIASMRQKGAPYREPEIYFAVPEAVDEGLDMAVIQLYSGPGGYKIDSPNYLILNSKDSLSLIGQHITIVGHPEGHLKKWTDGVVAYAEGKWFKSTAYILPGDSGSPVLDDEGQVVGLIHRGPSAQDLFTKNGANEYSIGTASESILAAMTDPLPNTMISVKASTSTDDFLDKDLVYLNAKVSTVTVNGVSKDALSLLGKACDTALARNDFESPNDLDNALKPCYHAQTWIECRNDVSAVPYSTVCPDSPSRSDWTKRFKSVNQLQVQMNGQLDYGAVSFAIASLQDSVAVGIGQGAETLRHAVTIYSPVLDYVLSYYLAAFNIEFYDNIYIKDYILDYRTSLHYELEATYIALAGSWLSHYGKLDKNQLAALLTKLYNDPNISVGTKLLIEDMKYQYNML